MEIFAINFLQFGKIGIEQNSFFNVKEKSVSRGCYKQTKIYYDKFFEMI